MSEITVYTSEPSVVSARVKTLLDKRKIPYTEISIQTDADRQMLAAKSGRRSCPLVYAGDVLIGGLEETLEAVRSGVLMEMAAKG